LLEAGLIPQIICGASIGSIIAAIVAVRTDEELPRIFESGYLNLEGFKHLDGQLRRKLKRLMTEGMQCCFDMLFNSSGVLMDIGKLGECVRANVGDLTFEEAYRYEMSVIMCLFTK